MTKRWLLLLSAVILVLAFPSPGDARRKGQGHEGYRTYRGARAIDGDTFYYRGKRYRIQQYNAPERGQPGAREATRLLQRKLDSGRYRWKPVARDTYGRIIVRERPSPP